MAEEAQITSVTEEPNENMQQDTNETEEEIASTDNMEQDTNETNERKEEMEPNENNESNDAHDPKPIDADDLDAIDIDIHHHQRKNDVSINAITPIIRDIISEHDDDEHDEDAVIKNTQNNDEKEEDTTQKQTILRIEHGHCSEQGIRPTMEDQVVVESTLNVYGSKCTSGHLSIYGVFDGHGGSQCAEFCASHIINILSAYLLTEDSVANAFTLCISDLDTKVIESAQDASGSTCCIVLIDNKTYDLWCCNVGDSRCILINTKYTKVKQLSIEHKPDHPLEKQRIENANGWVTFGRVCGLLAVSRSLGDKDFKYEIENLVISTPDVTHHKLVLDEDQCIVLACDGLFDVFSNQQCMEWIARHSADGMMEVQPLTRQLCHDAIHVRKSKDNVSVLVLKIDTIEIEIDEEEEEDQAMNLSLNAFNGTEEIKETDKIYNSTSSNGSVASAISTNHNNENQNECEDTETNNKSKTKKHKFHVVMASDDMQVQQNQDND